MAHYIGDTTEHTYIWEKKAFYTNIAPFLDIFKHVMNKNTKYIT